jgi:soluble lytic murein transglycosylase-like protein
MPIDHHYHRDEGLIIWITVALGICVGVLSFYLAQNLSPPMEQVSAEAVWAYISELAPQNALDPEFVYALAWAESSLNAKARTSYARGIMQMSRPAWREVSAESYRHAWEWRTNIRVAIDYLVFCRDFLKLHDSFSYPLLAACYRYGPYHVRDKNFNILQVKQPKNEIYKRIFNGNIRPVEPPEIVALSCD